MAIENLTLGIKPEIDKGAVKSIKDQLSESLVSPIEECKNKIKHIKDVKVTVESNIDVLQKQLEDYKQSLKDSREMTDKAFSLKYMQGIKGDPQLQKNLRETWSLEQIAKVTPMLEDQQQQLSNLNKELEIYRDQLTNLKLTIPQDIFANKANVKQEAAPELIAGGNIGETNELSKAINAKNEVMKSLKLYDKGQLSMSDSEWATSIKLAENLDEKIKNIKNDLLGVKQEGKDAVQASEKVGGEEIDYSKDGKIQQLISERDALKKELANVGKDDSPSMSDREWKEKTIQLEKYNKKLKELHANASKKANGGGFVTGLLSKLPPLSILENIKQKITGIGEKFSKTGKSGKQSGDDIGKSFKKGLKNTTKILFGVRSIFTLIRKVRTEIIKSFNTIATQFPEFNKELSATKTKLLGLKASVGTMLQPLVSAVLPILNKIIEVATIAAEKIGSAFAALTGQNFIYKATANWQDYADAVDGANKKLGAYDKLNVIGDNNNSNTLDVNYTKADLDSSVKDFIDMVKQAWENADFTNIGAMIGEKLQEGLAVLRDDVIPKLDETGIRLANSIGTLLNGFVGVENLGADIGTTIADLANVLIHFFDNLVTSIDFAAIGEFISSGLQSLIFGIDWTSVAHSFIECLIALYDFVAGLITGIDWSNLIGNLIQSLKDFLAGIDLGALADSFFTLFGSAIAAAFQLLVGGAQSLWSLVVDVASKIGEYFNEGFTEGINKLFGDIGNWLKEHVVDPFVKGFKKLFGISSPSKVMKELGGYIVDGLIEPIKNIPTKVSEIFTKVKDKVINIVTTLVSTVKSSFTNFKSSLVEIFRSLVNALKTPINTIIGFINKLLGGIETMINGVVRGLNALHWDAPSWLTNLTGIKSFGFNLRTISLSRIPTLAQGAVIPPNREFLAMLGDQTSGTNIEAPLDTIKQALAEVLSNGNGSNQPIVLQLDGKTIARVVWDENKKRYKQTGVSSYAY